MAETDRSRKRLFLSAYKQVLGCRSCDESEPVCLDLHHVDPATKYETLKQRNRMLQSFGWGVIRNELEKCEVLCANCHRKETYGCP